MPKTINISDEAHKKIKVQSAKEGKKIQAIVEDLIFQKKIKEEVSK